MTKIIFLFVFIACNTNVFSQNMGIGTFTPVAKLHIKGNADTTQLLIDAFGTQTNARPIIKIRNNSGLELLRIHTDDTSNLFIGSNAGLINIVGFSGLNINHNTFIGGSAGRNNTDGAYNTASGFKSLYYRNPGIGIMGFNTASGSQSLYFNASGSNNVSNGSNSLYSLNTGNNNTANGFQSMYNNFSGSDNTGTGDSTFAFRAGNQNTATGSSALLNVRFNKNTAIGAFAFGKETDAGRSTASGCYSLYGGKPGFTNIIQDSNTACGYRSLFSNTYGKHNSANGAWALSNFYTSSYLDNEPPNTATGAFVLANTTLGTENTAIGYKSMYSNTTGYQNTAGGNYALYSLNLLSIQNTAYGLASLFNTFSSSDNTAFGYRAGDTYNMGSNNILIGSYSNASFGGMTNSIAIGEQALVTANDQVRFGNSSTTSIGGYAGWSTISDGRVKNNVVSNVPGLSFINKLTPVTYNLDLDAISRILQPPAKKDMDGKIIPAAKFEIDARKEKEKVLYSGFIAQDVEKAAKELGYDFSGVDAAKNDRDLYGLRYAEFVVPLVKAVQELAEQNTKYAAEASNEQQQIESLQKINEAQKKVSRALQEQIVELKSVHKK